MTFKPAPAQKFIDELGSSSGKDSHISSAGNKHQGGELNQESPSLRNVDFGSVVEAIGRRQ